MVEPTSTRLRSSARSSSGTATRRSTATKAKPATTETAKQPRVATESQPQSPLLLTAEDQRRERQRDEHRAGVVDGPSAASGRVDSCDRRRRSAPCSSTATPASIQNSPCHPVMSTSTPPSSGPAAAPTAAAAPHSDTARSCASPLLATDSRLRPQARIVAPAAPWMTPSGDHHAAGLGERDQHARDDEQQQAELEDPLAAEDVTQRAGRDDHGGADQRVAGHRPLQRVDRHAGVLGDRRQQDADRRGVGVHHQRGDAGRREDCPRTCPRLGDVGHADFLSVDGSHRGAHTLSAGRRRRVVVLATCG